MAPVMRMFTNSTAFCTGRSRAWQESESAIFGNKNRSRCYILVSDRTTNRPPTRGATFLMRRWVSRYLLDVAQPNVPDSVDAVESMTLALRAAGRTGRGRTNAGFRTACDATSTGTGCAAPIALGTGYV